MTQTTSKWRKAAGGVVIEGRCYDGLVATRASAAEASEALAQAKRGAYARFDLRIIERGGRFEVVSREWL